MRPSGGQGRAASCAEHLTPAAHACARCARWVVVGVVLGFALAAFGTRADAAGSARAAEAVEPARASTQASLARSGLWPWLVAVVALCGGAGLCGVARRRPEPADAGPRAEPTLRIEISFIGLAPTTGGGGFALPADRTEDGDPRPVASFEVRVFEQRDGSEQPVPDGTEVVLLARSAHRDPTAAPITHAEIEIALRKRGEQTRVRTQAGRIFGRLRCGPSELAGMRLAAAPAARYVVGRAGIELFEAASVELVASAPDRTSASQVVEVVAGVPQQIELVGSPDRVGVPPGALRAPGGVVPETGEALVAIDGMRFVLPTSVGLETRVQHAPRQVRLGGWLEAPPTDAGTDPKTPQLARLVSGASPSGAVSAESALVGLVARVRDAAGNPVALAPHDSSDPSRPVLRFRRWKGAGSLALPAVVDASARHAPGDPKRARSHLGWVAPFPEDVLSTFVVPCHALCDGANTDLEIAIADRAWRFRIAVEPTARSAKLQHWFVSEELPSKPFFAGEISLSLLPFLVDGRDGVVYGSELIRSAGLCGVDRAIAVLSLAGLILDVVPSEIHVSAAAESAKSAVKLLRKIPEVSARSLANAISDHVGESAVDLDKLAGGQGLGDSREFARYRDAIAELGVLGEAVKRAKNPEQAQRLLAALGSVVVACGLAPLLEILARRGVDETIDLLEGLVHLDERDSR